MHRLPYNIPARNIRSLLEGWTFTAEQGVELIKQVLENIPPEERPKFHQVLQADQEIERERI